MSYPWFPLFANDFLSSSKIAVMTTEEIGAYILLLCHAWNDPRCSLPNDDILLQQLGKLTSDLTRIKSCFVVKRGRLVNRRLYTEWEKSKHIHEIRTEYGRKGGLAKATAYAKQKLKQTSALLQSQSQSQEEKNKEKTIVACRNGSSEPERNYRQESKVVLAFLNEKTGKTFREVESNLAFIEARLKSGVDVQTCKTLIARKVRDWTPKPEMVQYLRPETLFNKTKFETYLAEVTR